MKLERYKDNPILKPNKANWWESQAVFNCAAVYKDGLVYLVYRAIGEYEEYISRLGLAVSRDGLNFERVSNQPIFEPQQDYERWGCEDPRLTELEGRIYLTYVAHSKPAMNGGGAHSALASTQDLRNFKKLGIITPEGAVDRDTVLFPEKINNRYVMLHRPLNWVGPEYNTDSPSIWIAYSDDLKQWFNHKRAMKPEEKWESYKIGAGPPPIKTEYGWLLIYHGVERQKEKNIYRAGAALLDLDDPSRIISRLDEPILEPQEEYEKKGDVPEVVFPEGTVLLDERLHIYYGAADKACCLATINLKDLIDWLT
ncbi:MAG: glycosidase [Candidatus Omnitrophica bacterium]|nr:glycosidase [Candidatus Omnitrophota bacterium]